MVLMEFGKSIFEISSINKFWVKLYAKLFNKLILTFPKMKNICINEYTKLLNIFEIFEFGNEENYDEFYDAVVGNVVKCQSNFAQAGPFTETILLGVVAQRPEKYILERTLSLLTGRSLFRRGNEI